jgi:TRAP-type transport system periplasmic protein
MEDVMTRRLTLGRRSLLGAAAAGVAAAVPLGRARATPQFHYRIGDSSVLSDPLNIRLNWVAARISKESKGRMTLSVFPNSELGGDNDLLSQVRTGAIDFAQPAGLILASILPVAAVNGMGFAFTNYTQVWDAVDGKLGEYLAGQIRTKLNLIPMKRRWDLGFRQVTNSIHPINQPADIAGMKLRVPGAPPLVSLFQALGAYPVSMQFGEVYTSLQTRVVGGEENPLSVIDVAKFYEVQKYCALTNHCWDGFWMLANAASWNALPPDLQDIVERAFDAGALLQRADLAKLNPTLQSKLESKGMEFTTPDPEPFRAKLAKAGYYKEWRAKIGGEAWSLLESYVGKLG